MLATQKTFGRTPEPLHEAGSKRDWVVGIDGDPDTWVSRQTCQLRKRRQEEPVERIRNLIMHAVHTAVSLSAYR